MAELTGTVVRIGPKFGFISPDIEPDGVVFLSLSELPRGAEVSAGTRVRFELEESRKGLRAVHVRVIGSQTLEAEAAAVIERARGELDDLAAKYGVAV